MLAMLLYHQNKKLNVQINFPSLVQARIIRSSTISRASLACFPIPLGFSKLLNVFCIYSATFVRIEQHLDRMYKKPISFSEALSFELLSMPHCIKLTLVAASLLRHWLVYSIYFRGLLQLLQHHGSLTALICFTSIIDKHIPFGAPNRGIIAK